MGTHGISKDTLPICGGGTTDGGAIGDLEGFWAGLEPAASFAGAPLTATVAFPTPHPDGTGYAISFDERVIAASGLSLDLSIENKTVNGFDIVLNTAGPVPNLIGIEWQVQPYASSIPGLWAGVELNAAFAGVPLTATVVFGAPHPSGTDYAPSAEEVVIAGTGLSLDISIENKTANGFDIVLNVAGPQPNLIQVEWQVQPYGVQPGPVPSGEPSLPGIRNIWIVDDGTNLVTDGTQQYPYHNIQDALAVANSGDLVLFYPGTYTEQITPVDGVVVRGVDQTTCILQSPGNDAGDAPIATAASEGLVLENCTLQTTVVNGYICITGASQNVVLKDVVATGNIEQASAGSVVQLERNVSLTGQFLITGGDGTTQIIVQDSLVTGPGAGLYPISIGDANPLITVLRSRVVGTGATEAIYWSAANDNLKIAWSSVEHGSGGANNPFGRSAAETPNYISHHNAYNSDPEAGAIWTNLVAVGQRFDALDANAVF